MVRKLTSTELRRLADATCQLKNAVAHLNHLYDEFGVEECNETQPDLCHEVYAMSLDEWALMLATVEEQWKTKIEEAT